MLNSRRWQQGCSRRVWTVHEDLQHQAWLRVLQGRRPPPEQWPHARAQQQHHTGSRPHIAAPKAAVSKESAPNHQTTRTAGLRLFVDSTTKKTTASERAMKLRQALNNLSDTEGPEVEGLRTALKRAESDMLIAPIDVQVKECESFLKRARLHMEELDQKRLAVGASIDDAEKRLAALKLQQECAPPSPRGAEVAGSRVSVASTTPRTASRPRPRRAMRANGETTSPSGTGACLSSCHAVHDFSRVECVAGGAPCRSPRRAHERRARAHPGTHFQAVRRSWR